MIKYGVCLEDPEAEEIFQHPMCTNIVYFGQDSDRHEGADTTNSILRTYFKSAFSLRRIVT